TPLEEQRLTKDVMGIRTSQALKLPRMNADRADARGPIRNRSSVFISAHPLHPRYPRLLGFQPPFLPRRTAPTSCGRVARGRRRRRTPESASLHGLTRHLLPEEQRVEDHPERAGGLAAPIRVEREQHDMPVALLYVDRGSVALEILVATL